MAVTPFSAENFTPTSFSTAEDKAETVTKLARFIDSGFKRTLFTKALYQALSLHFYGHIAHFNQHGFWETWFSTPAAQRDFLEHAVGAQCYGVPSATWCDAERALQQWIKQSGALDKARVLADEALEAAERAELARLQAKYA